MDKKAINQARAIYYGLFSSLFAFVLEEERFAGVEETIEILLQNPIDENSKKALKNMNSIIKVKGNKFLIDEYDGIFYDLTCNPVSTTASFYEEDRDDGKKRILMVDYVLQSNYRRNTQKYTDLEDDIGFVLSFMQKLILDEIDGDEKAGFLEKEVFEKVLNNFVDEFIDNVYMHENSAFYQEVALLLKIFIEFERVFLGVKKPKEKVKVVKKEDITIADAEALRRLENKRKKSEEIRECIVEAGGDVEDEV
jgi:TorA maturation chaperone TorD